jgi:hypothetical protein
MNAKLEETKKQISQGEQFKMQTAPTKSPKSKARMQKITDFEVLAEIAKSKYSRVVRAYNNVKNRLSVLKILPKMKIVQHNQAE